MEKQKRRNQQNHRDSESKLLCIKQAPRPLPKTFGVVVIFRNSNFKSFNFLRVLFLKFFYFEFQRFGGQTEILETGVIRK